jgi:salicylate hydroxylase
MTRQKRLQILSLERMEYNLFVQPPDSESEHYSLRERTSQIVRRTLLPDHQLSFTGTIAWRVIVPKASLANIPDITSFTSWWWGEKGHVYFSDVDDDSEEVPHFEITVRGYREPEIPGKTVVWGVPASNDRVASRVEV